MLKSHERGERVVLVPEPKVCATRCEHCGFEVTLFVPATGECPRCGRSEGQRYSRWFIAQSHTVTIAATTASVVYVELDQGDWLEMRGGHDWGRVDMPGLATPFRGLAAALERLASYGGNLPVKRIVSESEAFHAE